MVKNQNGGNKGKHVARKDTVSVHKKIRLMKEEGEIYAVVTKMLGNCQCNVICLDGITRLCIIRKKFTGKHKHQHFIKPGIWVLVGTRDWETNNKDKIPKCDLLECYNETDKQTICQQSDVNVESLIMEEKKLEGDELAPSDVVFTDVIFEEEVSFDDI